MSNGKQVSVELPVLPQSVGGWVMNRKDKPIREVINDFWWQCKYNGDFTKWKKKHLEKRWKERNKKFYQGVVLEIESIVVKTYVLGYVDEKTGESYEI